MSVTFQTPTIVYSPTPSLSNYRQQLKMLLTQDLGFHNETSANGRHNLHSFPAKFPPQLPRLFINSLTQPDDWVLDPMMGSGTTIIEAVSANRRGIGFDVDPLAMRLCKAKTSNLDSAAIYDAGIKVAEQAQRALDDSSQQIENKFSKRFDAKTLLFIEYWFAPYTRLELMALLLEIERVQTTLLREFLELIFSAIVITKSGGVSLARDLAHTRPHRVAGKIPRPAIKDFVKRLEKNSKSLAGGWHDDDLASVQFGNAEALPLADGAIDLIVTSPPYASNAIDYMRAHKFSLVWFGHPITELSTLRSRYIGGESTTRFEFASLPTYPASIVEQITTADRKKGLALHRYYSEITRFLREAHRVLKPGKAAILVVGSSTMRGINTQTHVCIGEIGQALGFDLVGIAARQLDRNRRMMPARFGTKRASQIEERMHEEQVIALLKPNWL